MTKQTAVEWLWNNLTDDMIGELSPEQIKSIYQLIEQAKEMERQQIIDAYHKNPKEAKWKNIGVNYYNETYRGGEQ